MLNVRVLCLKFLKRANSMSTVTMTEEVKNISREWKDVLKIGGVVSSVVLGIGFVANQFIQLKSDVAHMDEKFTKEFAHMDEKSTKEFADLKLMLVERETLRQGDMRELRGYIFKQQRASDLDLSSDQTQR